MVQQSDPFGKAELSGQIFRDLGRHGRQGREIAQLLPGLKERGQRQALPAAIGSGADKTLFGVRQFVAVMEFFRAEPFAEAWISGAFDRGHEKGKKQMSGVRQQVSEKGSAVRLPESLVFPGIKRV